MSTDLREGEYLLDGRELSYRLERRKGRRKVSLFMQPELGLLVRAPRRFPLREVEAVLREEEDWIRRQLAWREEWLRRHPPRSYAGGETLPLLGEDWVLEPRREAGRRRARVLAREGRLILELPPEADAREVLEAWLRRLARRLVLARVEHWSALVGRRPVSITLRDTTSRWGSCSAEGNISINWKLVMAPAEALDYVVVHELCHLLHPNHSSAFWGEVERHMPGYRRPRRWLRDGRGEPDRDSATSSPRPCACRRRRS